jgi:hypothetical protein
MLSFLHGLSVDVISWFQAKSRRRRNDMNYHLRKAFHLCIDEGQVDRLLNENSWPEDIVISYWFFKGEGQPGLTSKTAEVIIPPHLPPILFRLSRLSRRGKLPFFRELTGRLLTAVFIRLNNRICLMSTYLPKLLRQL